MELNSKQGKIGVSKSHVNSQQPTPISATGKGIRINRSNSRNSKGQHNMSVQDVPSARSGPLKQSGSKGSIKNTYSVYNSQSHMIKQYEQKIKRVVGMAKEVQSKAKENQKHKTQEGPKHIISTSSKNAVLFPNTKIQNIGKKPYENSRYDSVQT